MVFAAAVGVKDVGYALTASQVASDVRAGRGRCRAGIDSGLRLTYPAAARSRNRRSPGVTGPARPALSGRPVRLPPWSIPATSIPCGPRRGRPRPGR